MFFSRYGVFLLTLMGPGEREYAGAILIARQWWISVHMSWKVGDEPGGRWLVHIEPPPPCRGSSGRKRFDLSQHLPGSVGRPHREVVAREDGFDLDSSRKECTTTREREGFRPARRCVSALSADGGWECPSRRVASAPCPAFSPPPPSRRLPPPPAPPPPLQPTVCRF